MVNAQEYLDKNYPKEERKNVRVLNLENENLEGVLDLTDFTNLNEMKISGNQLNKIIMPTADETKNLSLKNEVFDALYLLEIKKHTNDILQMVEEVNKTQKK